MSGFRVLLLGAALSSLVVWLSSTSQACDLCFTMNGNPFSLGHPRAIEIAVATRKALDKGLIPSGPIKSRPKSANGWDHRKKLSGAQLIKTWTEMLNATKVLGSQEKFCLQVVLVDTSETCLVQVRGGMAIVESRSTGHGDVVVATTCIALQAVQVGDLSLDEAVACGIVILDRQQHLAQVLSRKGK